MILLKENFFSSGANADGADADANANTDVDAIIKSMVWDGVSKQVMIYTNILVLYVIQFKSL